MKITDILFYNGAKDKICRLGASSVFLEVLEAVFMSEIFLLEKKDANGGKVVREKIDASFTQLGWKKGKAGEIDWVKRYKYNATIEIKVGVEVQVSARSDLLIRDIVHLRNSIQKGEIDFGVIIVPSEKMQRFLPDRTPSIRDARKYIEEEFREAENIPLVLISIEHDGPSDVPLPKQSKKHN